jgi:hypothetical protein
MSSYNSHAFVSGLTTVGTTVAIGGYAVCFADSVPLQHVSRLTEHIGANGKTGALQWDDDHTMSITFRPAKKGVPLDPATYPMIIPTGAVVALTGFHPVMESNGGIPTPDLSDRLNSPDWLVVGDTTVTLNASGVAEVQLQIRQYPNNIDIKVHIPAWPMGV